MKWYARSWKPSTLVYLSRFICRCCISSTGRSRPLTSMYLMELSGSSSQSSSDCEELFAKVLLSLSWQCNTSFALQIAVQRPTTLNCKLQINAIEQRKNCYHALKKFLPLLCAYTGSVHFKAIFLPTEIRSHLKASLSLMSFCATEKLPSSSFLYWKSWKTIGTSFSQWFGQDATSNSAGMVSGLSSIMIIPAIPPRFCQKMCCRTACYGKSVRMNTRMWEWTQRSWSHCNFDCYSGSHTPSSLPSPENIHFRDGEDDKSMCQLLVQDELDICTNAFRQDQFQPKRCLAFPVNPHWGSCILLIVSHLFCKTNAARNVGTGVHDGDNDSLPFERGATEAQVPLHNSITGNFRDAGKRWNDGVICPCPFKRGRRCLFITES